jgi:dihydroorotate dehydrogenase (fumarate)
MDLTTSYLGLALKSPIVPSASPLSRSVEMSREMEDAGAGAIIMYSLFEEAITAEEETMTRFLHHQDIGHGEAQSFLPDYQDFEGAMDRYLDNLRRLKDTLDIPIIASLNGVTDGGWISNAKELQQAGADALELNVYYVAGDLDQSGAVVEQRYVDLLTRLSNEISIPINMKLGPWFSSVPHLVKQMESAGASGVSLFNRFYQPDINVDSMQLQPSLHPSTSIEALLTMRWIAILYGRTSLSLGATSGIHTAEDAVKLLLAGADAVHMASALLEHGPGHVRTVRKGIEAWMEEHGFEQVDEFRGRVSQSAVPDPSEFERANYVHILDSYSFAPGARV